MYSIFKNKNIVKLLCFFIGWRLIIFFISLLAISFVPNQINYLGGGLVNYNNMPWFWGQSNFDGEHYLSIAQSGYGKLQTAFFPVYPFLIKFFGTFFGSSMFTLNLIGSVMSSIFLLIGLFGFYKILKIDYKNSEIFLTILILLAFPTSFYFGMVYTEALFFALVVWSFYFARIGNWTIAAIIASVASGTRVIGILLLPALLIEYYLQNKFKKPKRYLILLCIVPLGILGYTVYQKTMFGDPLAFIHTLPNFGEQRSSVPIMIPQIIYRYLFKILPNLGYTYFPIVFTTLLEFSVSLIFLCLAVYSYFKIRLSYSVFFILGLILPTLSGSFSSMPRYVLILFPAFIIIQRLVSRLSFSGKMLFFSISLLLLIIAESLFIRGYWLS